MKDLKKVLFFPVMIVCLGILFWLISVAVNTYDSRYGMHKISDESRLSGLADNAYSVVYEGDYQGIGYEQDNILYISYSVVNDAWSSHMLFYSPEEQTVFYTTQMERTSFAVGGTEFQLQEDTVYMNVQTAEELFGLQYHVDDDDRLILVRSLDGLVGEVVDSGYYLLSQPGDDVLEYVKKLSVGETLELYDCDTSGYYKAVDMSGHIGYVSSSCLQVSESKLSKKEARALDISDNYSEAEYFKVVFHQLYSDEFSYDVWAPVENATYCTSALYPTWFTLNQDGTITSIANSTYVEWARYAGLQVWGVLTNSFDDDLTYEALHTTSGRDAVCQQALELCQEYNLHGINVDFENISEATEPYFAQFLRELSITLRTNNYMLSVDLPPVSIWTDYYERDSYCYVCDYVIVMAYDEHYDGSEPGSVASKDFTEEAITGMLEYCPAEKLLLGIPWYTRLYATDENGNVTSQALSMDDAAQAVIDLGLTETYDASTGQNYAEGTLDGVYYQMWLEDVDSQKFRLQLMKKYSLRGFAAWSFGFENWQVFQAFQEEIY